MKVRKTHCGAETPMRENAFVARLRIARNARPSCVLQALAVFCSGESMSGIESVASLGSDAFSQR